MRRSLPLLLVAFGLALFAALAWTTAHPEAAWLDRASRWPGVGLLVQLFQDAYRPPVPLETPANPASAPAAPGIGWARGEEEASPVLPRELRYPVWIQKGTPYYSATKREDPPLGRAERLAQLTVVQRDGDWHRVLTAKKGPVWVHLPDYWRPSEPLLGDAAVPVAPLPAVELAPEELAHARELLGAPQRELRWGSYRVLTDVADEALLARCAELVPRVEPAWNERYRLPPTGEAAETLVLFAERDAFRRFVGIEPTEASIGYSGPGFAALYAEGRLRELAAATLVHEIGHLLHRRALGPALPAWLSEGLAEDVAGHLTGPVRIGGDSGWWAAGPAAAPVLYVRARAEGRAPSLDELLATSEVDYRSAERGPLLYAAAALWVGYLSEQGDGFDRYLQAIAEGSSGSRAELEEALGRDLPGLERGFEGWVTERYEGARELSGSTSRQSDPPSR